MKTAYCVNWTEYEREPGWGCTQREDGYTLYANKELMEKHLKEKVGNRSGPTPNYYINPGTPFIVEVNDKQYKEVQEKGMIWGPNKDHRSRNG